MSLDIHLEVVQPCDVFSANITHNLRQMAIEAGIYGRLWHPEDYGVTQAEQLVDPLAAAIAEMRLHPSRFKQHDAINGWGTYDHFLPWLVRLLEACREHPDATIRVSI